jgi:hypothetical protein
MSRYWDDADVIERRIRRALVVEEFGRVSWREYIQQRKQQT